MSALEMAKQSADEKGATCIHRVTVRIGALSGVDKGALQFAFEAVAPDVIGEGAELSIVEAPARFHCPACGQDWEKPNAYSWQCPGCEHFPGELLSGREIELMSVEFS